MISWPSSRARRVLAALEKIVGPSSDKRSIAKQVRFRETVL
jgi:hypothetical protein